MSEHDPDTTGLRIENAIGNHERDCREGDGPISKLRQEVSELKGWAKVVSVALLLTPLWLAIGGWALTGYIGARIDKALNVPVQAHAKTPVRTLIPSASAAEDDR